MNIIDRKLTCLYVSTIVLALLVSLFFELISPDSFGFLFDESDRTWRTVFETASIVTSLAGIYGALKLMALPSVTSKIKEEASYMRYAIIRWTMVALSLMLSEITYYFFCSTNVVAFVGICAIALLFVWPTKGRRMREMGIEENLDNKNELA